MSPRLLLLPAMAALAILAAGHTLATLERESGADPHVAAAFAAMRAAIVPRTVAWLPRSMADFNLGMNLNLSFSLVAVVALLALLLPSVDAQPQLIRRLLWPIEFFTLAIATTSFWFFVSLPATALCLIAALCLALAQAGLRRDHAG